VSIFKNKTIEIADDLSEITQYDPDEEIQPGIVGMTPKDVNTIWSGVENLYRTGLHPAISFCLRRRGQIVIKRAIGHSCGNGPDEAPGTEKTAVSTDTPFCLYSTSKAITAMLVHLLAERKKIRLDETISRYIPEFAENGKEDVTVRHAMTHQGGFPSLPRKSKPDSICDFDAMVKMLCESRPEYPAGRHVAYHPVSCGFILGEIVKRVSGKNLQTFLKEEIQKPLGLKYFNYGISDNEIKNVAVNYFTGLPVPFPVGYFCRKGAGGNWNEFIEISNKRRFYKTVIPAVNLTATADEMSLFFQMLLNGGDLNGTRIFKPETVRQAVKPARKQVIDRTIFLPMRYSAGMMLGNNPVGLYGPFTREVFGHWGFVNIFCWADPSRDTVVAMLNSGKPFIGSHLKNHASLLTLLSWHCRR
jgi:CubicO group peptidase (beta-lactamase class C family)